MALRLASASSALRFSSACFFCSARFVLPAFPSARAFFTFLSRSFFFAGALSSRLPASRDAHVRAFHAPAVRRVHAFPAPAAFLALDGNVRFAGVRLFLRPWRQGEAAAPRQRVAEALCRRGRRRRWGGDHERVARPAAEPLTTARLPLRAGRSSWSSSPMVSAAIRARAPQRPATPRAGGRAAGGELVAFVVSVHGWPGDAAVSAALLDGRPTRCTPAFCRASMALTTASYCTPLSR